MSASYWSTDWPALAACFLAALVLTLVLAARLTPRRWWRRPNLQALAVLGGGTLAFGALFATLFATLFVPLSAPAAAIGAVPLAAPIAAPQPTAAPAAGAVYRVVDELNLRSERGVRGERLAVLPAGTPVAATGAAHGDWWQVRATLHGRTVTGWASSLWLRRADERPRNTRDIR